MGIKGWAGSLGLGAAIMYVLDPERGRRRRAVLRDKSVSLGRQSEHLIEKAGRDLRNRAKGLEALVESRFHKEEVSDDVLRARVRACLGRVTSHPRVVDVTVEGGMVTLRGPILAHEVPATLAAVAATRGVQDVRNELEPHESGAGLPSLQGGTRRARRSELMQTNWTPAVRVLVGAAGGALTAYGFKRGHVAGTSMGLLGLGFLARSAINRSLARPAASVQVHKTVTVNAPVEEVYDFWNLYENFPRFMSHLKEVRETGEGRSHWIAAGPAGIPVEWDAEISQRRENRLLAWRSLPGSQVETSGSVHFQPAGENKTRLEVHLRYSPVAGALGDIVARLFAADPKTALDEDLVRLKSLLEQGKTRKEGETISREEAEFPPPAV